MVSTENFQGDGSKPVPFMILDTYNLVITFVWKYCKNVLNFFSQESVDGYVDYRMVAHELHHAYVWDKTSGMVGQGAAQLKYIF